MAWIGKKQGGSGVGPHWWDEDGSAVEITDDALVRDLLSHPSGEFFRAEAPKAKAAAKSETPKGDAPKPAAPAATPAAASK